MDHLADRHYDNYSPEDAEEERRNFLSVLKAFRYYRYVFNLPLIKIVIHQV